LHGLRSSTPGKWIDLDGDGRSTQSPGRLPFDTFIAAARGNSEFSADLQDFGGGHIQRAQVRTLGGYDPEEQQRRTVLSLCGTEIDTHFQQWRTRPKFVSSLRQQSMDGSLVHLRADSRQY
jgi:hypothetical protein